MKNLFVKDIKPGAFVSDFFVLRKKELKEYDGQKFLKLELGDESGRIDAVLWEKGEKFFKTAEVGEVVKVKGVALTYKNSLQLKLENLEKITQGKIDPTDFLPKVEEDLDLLVEKFKSFAKSIKDLYLKNLLELFINDSNFMEKLKLAPGGKLWHHSFLGGLLKHTLKVAELCEKAACMYPLVQRDLLLAGALLHDIGKITQFKTKGFIDYTDEGRLVGHVVSGYDILSQKIEKVKDFPQKLSLQLKHLILSHQGELELASPVVPQTIEAIILHYADQMDAQADAFARIIEKHKALGEKWSNWVPLIKRFIYAGEEGLKEPVPLKQEEEE